MRFDFYADTCDSPVDFKRENIVKSEWIDYRTLKVQVYVAMNCCNEVGTGDFEIQGQTLALKFEDIGEDVCDCVCGVALTYVFFGIEHKDYYFEVWPVRLKLKPVVEDELPPAGRLIRLDEQIS